MYLIEVIKNAILTIYWIIGNFLEVIRRSGIGYKRLIGWFL